MVRSRPGSVVRLMSGVAGLVHLRGADGGRKREEREEEICEVHCAARKRVLLGKVRMRGGA